MLRKSTQRLQYSSRALAVPRQLSCRCNVGGTAVVHLSRNNGNPSGALGSQYVRSFHSSPRREGLPMALLASVLKASVSIEYARMAARIALTFVPIALLKNHFSKKVLNKIAKHEKKRGTTFPEWEEKKEKLRRHIVQGRKFSRILLAVPITLLGLTCLASLERTPLSGRWRLILLSPEEEGNIAAQLSGDGWFNVVGEILAQEGPFNLIPCTDWRYKWVNETLRQLESVIPILAMEKQLDLPWLDRTPEDAPLPPPAKYPLRPRPAAREYLRWFCEKLRDRQAPTTSAHTITGPPYSLVIVDRPDSDNAFSFGFGPDGSGGIVVYSGFIDHILAKYPCSGQACEDDSTRPSFLTSFLGGLLGRPRSPPVTPIPSQEQTTQLAILLAHELAHLILSHHLETLSSGTILIPGTVSMASDVLRAVLFPVTMFFGPFVNDAVAIVGSVGTGEIGKLTEFCTSMNQEYEADTVSVRILAHAGFDARKAVSFWQERDEAEVSECSPKRAEEYAAGKSSLARRIMGSTHPQHSQRVARLKAELDRWETKRMKALQQLSRTFTRTDIQDQTSTS